MKVVTTPKLKTYSLSSLVRGKSLVARGERSETPGTDNDDDTMNVR